MNEIKIVRAKPEEVEGIKLVRAGDAPVKKKEPTIAPLKEEDTPTDSELEKTPKPPSSVSSASKRKVYTDYPGKEGREYELVAGQWRYRDEAPTEVPNMFSLFTPSSIQSSKHTPWKEIKNEGRINALNNHFLRTAQPTKAKADTPTALDFQKQKDIAERKTLEWGEAPVEEAIIPTKTASEKQKVFEKEFIALEKGTPEQLEIEAKAKKKEDFLNQIDSDLIGKNEEQTVESIRAIMANSGDEYDIFDFEEIESGVDAMRVTNRATGQHIDVSLDNWTDDRDKIEARVLKGFINVGISNPEYNRKAEEANDMYIELAKLDRGSMEWNEANANLIEKRRELEELNVARIDDAITDKYTASAVYNKAEAKKISSDLFDVSKQSAELKKSVTDSNEWYAQVRENYDKGLITDEEWNNTWVPKIKAEEESLLAKQGELASELERITEKGDSLNKVAATHYLTQEQRGSTIGGVGKSFMAGAGNVFNFLTHTDPNHEFISGDEREAGVKVKDMFPGITTDEYLSSANRNILQQLAFGLSRSIGASVTGAAMTGGAAGPVGGFLGLYADGYENMQEQLNVPEMAGVSKGEKVLLSFAYGSTVGLLEKYGLTKTFSKSPLGKSFTSWVLKKTFKEIPKGASAEMIERMTKDNIKLGIAKGLTNVIAGSITEGSTELAQELAEISIKEVYNTIKDKEYFETPKTFDELAGRLGNSALMGILGGGLMNAASQSGNVLRNGFKGSDIGVVGEDMLKAMATDPDLRKMYVADLKLKVVGKKMPLAEAEKKLADLDMISSTLGKIPEEVPISKKTQAFDLITEKDRLEREMLNKEPNLVVKQKARVEEINTELQELSTPKTKENAVQERETEKIPTQPEARASEEMGEGAEVKEATEEKEIETFESAVTKGAEQAVKWLDDVDKKLTDFGKETLGVNIPVVVAKGAIKAAKVLAQTTNNVSEIVDAAINHVRESDWFKKLNESDQSKTENRVRQLLSTGELGPAKGTTPIAEEPGAETRKKAPSVAKVLKTPKPETVTMTKRAALRAQIVMESRAAKEGAKSEKDVRAGIGEVVKRVLKETKGKFKDSQVKSITTKALKMNLSNPVMAERFVDYVSKVAKDVEYDNKLGNALTNRKQVGKLGKGKKQQSELRGVAKKFSLINPRQVENIDEYIEMTAKIKSALTPTKTSGGKLSLRDTSGVKEVREYIDNQLEIQEERNKAEMREQFSSLFDTGLLNENMSTQEIRAVLSEVGTESKGSIKDEKLVRAQISDVYDVYSAIIGETLETGIDPFTGESVELTTAQVKSIKSALNLDIDELSLKEVFELVDMISNFASNGATGGMDSFASYFAGKTEAKEYFARSGKARKMNSALRAYDYHFASLPVLIDTMLTGVGKAVSFMTRSGLNELIRGANYAQRLSHEILKEYSDKFRKAKPNGEAFNTAKNTYERGMYAFLSRNVIGSESEMRIEFNRRVRIINESIEYLTSSKASSIEAKKGAIYKELVKKLGLDKPGVTMESVAGKVDPKNKEAVSWWINKWSEHYGDLQDVSLNIYNKDLDSDMNYTPDRYKRKATAEVADVEEVMNGAFGEFNDSAYNKESGSLMAANKPKILPKNRVIDLDFDINNYAMIEAALVDINTAGSIRKVSGFIQSESFNDIFSAEDGAVLKKRINNYILRTRRKEAIRDDQSKAFKKVTNFLAKGGTTMALGGVDQMFKQTIPVIFNTMINANGRISMIDAMSRDASRWINESGMPIAARGLGADVNIDAAESRLNKTINNGGKVIEVAGKLSDTYLKSFLSNPDKYVARASFIAYYKVHMKQQGLSTDIDYSAPMNTDASNYAQHMVDRQQNISDTNLAGEFFTNRTWSADLMKKTLFPFANFIMNQKSRMYSDLRTLSLKESNHEDKERAAKSLAGLATEMAIFHSISIAIRTLYKEAAQEITGYEPEKEDKDVIAEVDKENRLRQSRDEEPMTEKEERRFRYEFVRDRESKKNQKTFWTSVIKDMLSPVPPADDLIVMGFNKAVKTTVGDRKKNSKEATQAVKDENAIRKEPMTPAQEESFRDKWASEETFQLWDFDDKGKSYGVLGIASDKYAEYTEMNEAAEDGTVTAEFYGTKTKKYLLPEDQEVAKYNAWTMRLYLMGVLPSDFGKEAIYIQKNIKKSAFTEKEMTIYNELKKEGQVSKEDLKSIREGKTLKQIRREKAKSEAIFVD